MDFSAGFKQSPFYLNSSERTVGAALRGRPAWKSISRYHDGAGPVGVELDLGNPPAAQNEIPRRAATEGRHYSTFDQRSGSSSVVVTENLPVMEGV